MGNKFFSHRTPGRTQDARGQLPASEIRLEGRDHQQALVLAALRRAAGAPVSYGELRAAGVELPASVVSELELAGVAIERCCGEERAAAGVRLDPANDPATRPTPDPIERPLSTRTEPDPAWRGVRIYRASSLEGLVLTVLGRLARPTAIERDRAAKRGQAAAVRPAVAMEGNEASLRAKGSRVKTRRRAVPLAALLAGITLVAAFLAISAPGGERATRVPKAKRPQPRVVVTARAARPVSASRSTHPPPPAPVSPALAAELEARGHSLLEAGRSADAVPVLKRAVLATGETLGACLDPASSTCLTYAYALYDLGRAMRLSGQPQAAVPILERRLQIDNQRSTVGAQLQLARQGIS